MNPDCLKYRLTNEERRRFEEEGYLIIEDAVPPEILERFLGEIDKISSDELANNDIGYGVGRRKVQAEVMDLVNRSDVFLELIDWPKIFPKVWEILGPAIQLYISHLIVSPPRERDPNLPLATPNWHQDSTRMNKDFKGIVPQPRVSLKVGYFLTDQTEPGMGNLYLVPGSHLTNELSEEDGIPVLAKAGTAVLFDRRLYHASSPNHSKTIRKTIYYGYSYRWQRFADENRNLAELAHVSDPIKRQLLGFNYSRGYNSFFEPDEDIDIPLIGWLREQLGEAAPE